MAILAIINFGNSSKRSHLLAYPLFGWQDVAFVNPGLYADHAVRGARLRKTEFDIGPQGVQRQAALQVPFGSRDFIAIQSSRDPDLDALAAKSQS